MRQIMVFGCGNYGKQAALCFGEKIECFVDNFKYGGEFFGKPIISVEDIKKYKECMVLIAVHEYQNIARQLEQLDVKYTWYIEDNDGCYHNIENRIEDSMKQIAVLGINSNTEMVCRFLQYAMGNSCFSVTDKHGSESIGTNIASWEVVDFEDGLEEWDAVVIVPGARQTEYNYYCERLGLSEKVVNPIWHRRWFESGYFVKDLYSEELDRFTEEEYKSFIRESFDAEGIVNNCVEEMEKTSPFFHKVEIETVNRCNLNCSFCPVGASRDPRDYAKMSDELYYSIIDQLADMNYNGRLSLYSNNEPLKDERILKFQEYARRKLPDAFLYLVTNGTLLSLDVFQNIIPYLDEIVIDNYGRNKELMKPIQEIHDYCKMHSELWPKVKIALRNPDEYLTSRGGDSPNRTKSIDYPNIKCTLPWFQLIIRPTGEISTCCADAVGSRTMGDLKKQSLKEAWFSNEFVAFRGALTSGRGKVEKCKYCDVFNLW